MISQEKMAAMTASVLNNFADLVMSLPLPSLEATIKQNPAVVDTTGEQSIYNVIP